MEASEEFGVVVIPCPKHGYPCTVYEPCAITPAELSLVDRPPVDCTQHGYLCPIGRACIECIRSGDWSKEEDGPEK